MLPRVYPILDSETLERRGVSLETAAAAALRPGGRRCARRLHRQHNLARDRRRRDRIADLRGKWKASQNRNAADRAGVIAGLEAEGDEDALAMAAIVRDAAK